MRAVLVCAALLAAMEGIAHAEDPKTVWDDKQLEASGTIRSEFTTRTEPMAVERVACALGANAQIAGEDRPLEMRVEYEGKVVLCPTNGPHGFTLLVRIDPAPQQTFHVVVQADAPANSTADVRKDLDQTLHEVSLEIDRRSRGMVMAKIETKPPEYHARPTRAFSPALTVTGIVVAGIGVAAIVGGYFWLAGQSITLSDPAPPLGTMLAGGGGILVGALFALVGEHRVPADSQPSSLVIPGGFRF